MAPTALFHCSAYSPVAFSFWNMLSCFLASQTCLGLLTYLLNHYLPPTLNIIARVQRPFSCLLNTCKTLPNPIAVSSLLHRSNLWQLLNKFLLLSELPSESDTRHTGPPALILQPSRQQCAGLSVMPGSGDEDLKQASSEGHKGPRVIQTY